MTFEQIKELIDIVCSKGLRGIEIERSDFRLRIDGQAAGIVGDGEGVAVVGALREPLPAAGAPAGTAQQAAENPVEEGVHVIPSPIVGTFYAAPSPDSDPYIQVGDEVKAGQVLCIVEAMKLMNEIESDVDGEVMEIYGRNAQPVEYGEPLFAIRPA